MESILPLIIMLIIGALFKGKKKQPSEHEQQAKPFTAQQERQEDPLRRFKEKSREMYREIQQEMQQESERQNPPVQTPGRTVAARPVIVTPEITEEPNSSRRGRRDTSYDRQTINRRTPSQAQPNQRSKSTESLLPTTEEDLIKGVIFSEIFGPPKSRR